MNTSEKLLLEFHPALQQLGQYLSSQKFVASLLFRIATAERVKTLLFLVNTVLLVH